MATKEIITAQTNSNDAPKPVQLRAETSVDYDEQVVSANHNINANPEPYRVILIITMPTVQVHHIPLSLHAGNAASARGVRAPRHWPARRPGEARPP